MSYTLKVQNNIYHISQGLLHKVTKIIKLLIININYKSIITISITPSQTVVVIMFIISFENYTVKYCANDTTIT